jgi:hypothetical protein
MLYKKYIKNWGISSNCSAKNILTFSFPVQLAFDADD